MRAVAQLEHNGSIPLGSGLDQYFQDLWSNLVESYSICELTYPSDRLPAILGLASRFARIITSTGTDFGLREKKFQSVCCGALYQIQGRDDALCNTERHRGPGHRWKGV